MRRKNMKNESLAFLQENLEMKVLNKQLSGTLRFDMTEVTLSTTSQSSQAKAKGCEL